MKVSDEDVYAALKTFYHEVAFKPEDTSPSYRIDMRGVLENFARKCARLTQQTPAASVPGTTAFPGIKKDDPDFNVPQCSCDDRAATTCRVHDTAAQATPIEAQAMREAVQDTDEFITLAEHKAKMREAIEAMFFAYAYTPDPEKRNSKIKSWLTRFGLTEPTPAERVTVFDNDKHLGENANPLWVIKLDGETKCHLDKSMFTREDAEIYRLGLIAQLEKESHD